MMARFFTHFFIIAFLLNFLWEITQMYFFTGMGMGQIEYYNLFLKTHWLVSLKDAAMVLVLYVVIGLILRNWHWGRHFTKKRLGLLFILGFLWAVGIEYYHVNIHHDWAYAANMPLLPLLKVGLLPVLQMITLPAVAIWLAKKDLFV